MRRSPLAVLLLAVACSPAPAPSVPPAPTPSAAPTIVASASASASADPSAPPPLRAPELADDEGYDYFGATIDAEVPPAPCDLDRPYRGAVGGSRFSVALRRSGTTLRGQAAYDAGAGELDLEGSVGADGKIQLVEKKGGKAISRLTGKCEEKTGAISGTMEIAGGRDPKRFLLRPQQAGGTPIVERAQRIGKAKEGETSCHWEVRSPAVFGLGDEARATRLNDLLRVRFTGVNEADLQKQVRQCPRGVDRHATGWYSIEADTRGVLSVVENGYMYFGPAAHGDFNAAAKAVSIDVPTGRALALSDVVTSSAALRPLVTSCMNLVGDYFQADPWWLERAIQGVPADKDGEPVETSSPKFNPRSIFEPSFVVLPDGLAVLIRGQPTMSAFLELQGPVIRWGALLRDHVENPRSPVARLWAGEKPLAAGEPACVRMFAPRWLKPVKRKDG